MAGILVALALGSVIFLSAVMLVSALMLRGRWDSIGSPDRSDTIKK